MIFFFSVVNIKMIFHLFGGVPNSFIMGIEILHKIPEKEYVFWVKI